VRSSGGARGGSLTPRATDKGSDVNVAAHLLLDVLGAAVARALVISNDSDLPGVPDRDDGGLPAPLSVPEKERGQRSAGVEVTS
jgi:hypothetical protein